MMMPHKFSPSARSSPPSPRTQVRRHPERGAYDHDTICTILDEAWILQLSYILEGATGAEPRLMPTAFVRIDDDVYIHGATANATLRALADGRACVANTFIQDGLVFSKSAGLHSMNFRSVTIFGHCELVADLQERRRALDALLDKMSPGRSQEAMPASDEELAKQILVLRLSIHEASAKVRNAPPSDPPECADWNCWSGVLATRLITEDRR